MRYLLIFLSLLFLWSCKSGTVQKINLSGEWQFRIDSLDQGVREKWYEQNFTETVMLPGSMVENGKGNEITLDTEWTGGVQNPEWHMHPNYAPYHDTNNIRFPYWLQPKLKYTGASWYQKKVTIPPDWKEKVVWLNLERVHWESNVWVNGIMVGKQNSLATAHKYNISKMLQVGENIISICVDNRIKAIDVGENAHSISDHTQSNWNGIIGDISLSTTDRIFINNIKIYPSLKGNAVKIKAEINNDLGEVKNIKIGVSAALKTSNKKADKKYFNFEIAEGIKELVINYPIETQVLAWDEFEPNVYELTLDLGYIGGSEIQRIDFGFRDFKAHANGLTINDRPIFLRGTLECAIFPLTGYPPTDKSGWEKVFKSVRAHGLNHIRFHSWCPPKAAFQVADEMGIYLQIEASSWANQSTTLGSGLPVDEYIYEESKHIIDTYGNHPSFVMMTYGNEPGGDGHIDYLKEYVNYWKEEDNRRLYTSGGGWPVIEENDFHSTSNKVRIQGWGEGLRSIINSQPPKSDYDWTDGTTDMQSPIVSHEIGQWCVYPNFKEIKKYTGVLKAKNFELFEESLNASQLGHMADSFLLASGKLQALCYKADIEAALRTPNFGGFQLLDLHDFPGQGTALVGVLDPFWEEKGYISPEEYKRFCNETVPLVRLGKRVFNEGETLTAKVEVAHYGALPLQKVSPKWKIKSGEKLIAEGELKQQNIPVGNGIQLGKIEYKLKLDNQPRKLILEVFINEFINTWDIWVYPSENISTSNEIKIVNSLNTATIQSLEAGAKILLSLGKGKVSPEMGGDVGVGFSSIFWNTAWTLGQKPHTLGILCNPEHPALKEFPTEYHSNWQWWDAMSHSDAIQLDAFTPELKPIVRIIDDWVSNRSLALIFEAKVGKGSILVSGVDLLTDSDTRLEAKQLKTSILKYMTSDGFQPEVSLSASQLKAIVK